MSRLYAAQNGWRWVAWYVRRGRLVAALRQAWLAYVWGYDGEACQACGRSYPLWHAYDDLYGRVTGRWSKPDGESASGLFCIGCFDRMAEAKGITLKWRPEPL